MLIHSKLIYLPQTTKFQISRKNIIWGQEGIEMSTYFVFSFGYRLWVTQSTHHQGRAPSVPSKSVILFLQGPPLEPSVIIDGGETVENSNDGSTWVAWFSVPSSTSDLERGVSFDRTSFPDELSPFDKPCELDFCFLLLQWTSKPRSVSWAKLICTILGEPFRRWDLVDSVSHFTRLQVAAQILQKIHSIDMSRYFSATRIKNSSLKKTNLSNIFKNRNHTISSQNTKDWSVKTDVISTHNICCCTNLKVFLCSRNI